MASQAGSEERNRRNPLPKMRLYAAIVASTARRRHARLGPNIAVVCVLVPLDHLRRSQRREMLQSDKFCSPHVKQKPRFLTRNQTIFAGGSVASKPPTASLSPPPSPPRRRDYNTDRRGAPPTKTQDGRDAGGRCAVSPLAEASRSPPVTPCCLIGGDVASYERGKGEVLNP